MRHPGSTSFFALASLLPAACLLPGAFLGGAFLWAALASITLLVLVLDRMAGGIEAAPGLARWLPETIAAAHFATLAATLWAVGAASPLATPDRILLVVTMGLYAGQVSNAAAHELIHRSDKASRWLGTAVYCSVLNGQHVSAHLLVHHVHAGTPADPVSARVGRGFYRFALGACLSEFASGWQAESRRGTSGTRTVHPYAIYLGGACLSLLVAAGLGGVWGVVALLALSFHAMMQLLLSEYVQHYGLQRGARPDGRLEPMGPQHAWNAPHGYSGAMMVNAPRHADHHMHPGRPFTDLAHVPGSMPTLPHSLPVMGAIALVPPLWRRIMDPRCRSWRDAADRKQNSQSGSSPRLPATVGQ